MLDEYKPPHADALEAWRREARAALQCMERAISHMHDASRLAYGYNELLAHKHSATTAAWTVVDVSSQVRRLLEAVAADDAPAVNTKSSL